MNDSGANVCSCAPMEEKYPGKELDDLANLKARLAPRGVSAEDRIQRYECPVCGQKWEVHAISLYNAPSTILLKVEHWSPWPFDPQSNRIPDAAPPVPALPPQSERPWWRQIRLRTAVVLMFVAAGVLYLNVAGKPNVTYEKIVTGDMSNAKLDERGFPIEGMMEVTCTRQFTWDFGWPGWFVKQEVTEERRTFQIYSNRYVVDYRALAESYKNLPFRAQQVSYSPIHYDILAIDIAFLVVILFASFLILEGFRPLQNWLGWIFSR